MLTPRRPNKELFGQEWKACCPGALFQHQLELNLSAGQDRNL